MLSPQNNNPKSEKEKEKLNRRWAIYIDIEGFGALYDRDNQVIIALSDLMEGIYLIGEHCYPESPDRIFAHQIGDGFVIVGEFGSLSLEVPISIAIVLLRHIAACGRFGKAAIGEGQFADITGYYPERIRQKRSSNGSLQIGRGIMTLFPVMGTALIDAVSISKRSPSGSLLTLSHRNRSRVMSECKIVELPKNDIISIDWVHSQISLVDKLQECAGLKKPSPVAIEEAFHQYCLNHRPPDHWDVSTRKLLGLKVR
jgi:hypothetical protein